ncbi:MAG TPA: hypothetical protein VMK42_01660 [Anaeromyxobacteraceae bacterium]|nr:hypothetical protein [Anaeromyxobacteraceae bacterium]
MAGGLLFVSQALIDTWAEQGRIDFVGNVMTLLAGEGSGRRYALEPAVRFLKVLGAEKDPHQLLAKVKPLEQLRGMGAEAVENSVVMGDVAYEVEPGFLAEVSAIEAAVNAPRGAAPARPPPTSPSPAPPARAEPRASPGSAAAEIPPPAPRDRGVRPSSSPRDLEERRKEAEALARFLLDNLS